MKPIKISIIVPVYNVEKYLARCVDSLLKQTLTEIEIILVDDGSTDSSPSLCDDYATIHEHIKVFHKAHNGPSGARNKGIKVAQGQYVMFVDSDDCIEKDACEILYQLVEGRKIDIVVGSAKRIEGNRITYINNGSTSLSNVCSGEVFLKQELRNNTMSMAVCFNIYNRQFLMEHKLSFKEGILHEDEEWVPRVFLKAKQIVCTGYCFYNYMIRTDSITQQNNKVRNAIDLITVCYELAPIYSNIQDKELRALLNDYLVMLYLNAFYIGGLYRKQYRKLIHKQFVIQRVGSRKNRAKVILFVFNKRLYYYINRMVKYLERRKTQNETH